MVPHALCLVGSNLTQPKIDSLQAALRSRGGQIEGSVWLSPGRALDVYVNLPPEAPRAAILADVRRALPSIDAALVPLENRRKDLLVADMDSTLVTSETIVDMAARAGVGQEVENLTNKAMRGKIDFAEALMERVKLLTGMPMAEVEALAQEVTFNPGAEILCATMKAHGARLVLISGGFTHVTQHVAARLNLDRHVANKLAVVQEKLTGGLGLPLVDAAMKAEVVRQECAEGALDRSQILAVGDGANDLLMLGEAGLGVAYYGKPVLQAKADAAVNHGDLTTLLYFQGYGDQDFHL